jgi:hypothetical protein
VADPKDVAGTVRHRSIVRASMAFGPWRAFEAEFKGRSRVRAQRPFSHCACGSVENILRVRLTVQIFGLLNSPALLSQP